MRRPPALLDAPSNLGLRPPEPGAVPGCYKAPGALRDRGLLERLGARDAGVVVPPRYRWAWDGRTVAHADEIASYSRRLAERVQAIVGAGEFPFVLGGDCSILLGNVLALRRLGRHGLVFIDGHTDFRHPENAAAVGAAAGEDLALATGRGEPALVDVDGLRPYVRDGDVVVVGPRADDEYLEELAALGIAVVPAPDVGDATAGSVVASLPHVDGFWIHLDVDVIDPSLIPAVDSPDPGGLSFEQVVSLLRELVDSPGAVGLEVTVFDPDLDPDGALAARLADLLTAALAP